MIRLRLGSGVALGTALLTGCITAPVPQASPPETEARAATYAAVLTSRLALQRNEEAEALARLTQPGVPDDDPAVVALRLERALSAVDFPAAVSAAEAQARLGPPTPIAALVLAVDAINRNRTRQALTYLDLVPAEDHPGRLARVMRAWVLAGQNRLPEALALTEGGRAVEATGLLTTRALLLDRAGQTEAALALYARLPQGASYSHNEALARAVALHLARGDRGAAQALLAGAGLRGELLAHRIATAPASSRAPPPISLRHGLAISLDVARVSGPLILDSDRPGLAFWPITLVLGLDPSLGAPRIDLAAHHQFRRHPRAALAQLAAVPAGSPAFAAAQLQAAQLLTEQGDPAAALAAADAAVQHGHALPQAQLLRAKALLAQNQLPQAVEAATAGLTATPIDPAVRAALLQARAQARIAGSAPDPAAAIADLRAAMSATPRDPHPRARLVVLLAAAADPAEAQELLQGVNPRGLTDAALLVGLGRAGLQLGQRDRAMEALQHAARTAPTNAEALEALGDAYLSAGRVQDARLQWQRARSQPDLPPTIVARLTQKLETTQAARGGP